MIKYICPVCSSQDAGKSEKYRGKYPVFDDISIIECLRCGAWSAFPVIQQERLSILYEENYWNKEIYSRRLSYLEAQMTSRCEYIKSATNFSGALKVLDVGASVGVFNRVAGRCFEKCTVDYSAVEVNPAALDFLKNNCDNNRIFNSIDEAPGGFNLIILSHILEHISSPKMFLSAISEKLTDGGVIFVEVPNCDFRFKKYHQPHMLFYNISSLKKVIEQAGFKCMSVDTCGRKVRQMQIEANLSQYSLLEKVGQVISRLHAKTLTNNNLKNPVFAELETYGGDRRWIRLVAQKGSIKSL